MNNPYLFTGRRLDLETSNYYYRARYYKPAIGRFLQTDPIGYDDGLNMYTYCGNNPLSWLDPFGLRKEQSSEPTVTIPPDPFEQFMEFVRQQRVERGANVPFIHERIADEWISLPEQVRDYEPDNWWGRRIDDRGNHRLNQRLPSGYHITQDRGRNGVYIHYDAHDPLRGYREWWRHMREVDNSSVYQDQYPDWGE